MAKPRSESIPTTIGYLVDNFAGRKEWSVDDNYKVEKSIHIHRRNRAFVWNDKMVMNLFDSIMKGYVILQLVCCSVMYDRVQRREIMDGGNRLTAFWLILNNRVKELTEEERIKVRSFQITLIVMYDMSSHQIREQFSRLNICKKATSGQLYQMSHDDSPLVQEAILFITDISYPCRERCVAIFSDFFTQKDTDTSSILENVVGIISGTLNGVYYITTKFDTQEKYVEDSEPIDREKFLETFEIVLEIFENANETLTLDKKLDKKKQFTLGNFIGPILYDIHQKELSRENIIEKWSSYILMLRQGKENAKNVLVIKGAQNLNPDKLAKLSYSVKIFIEEERLLSEEDLKQIKHRKMIDTSDSDDDEDS